MWGSCLIQGCNNHDDDFARWYYNEITKKLEEVPDGFVLLLDPQFLDMDAPF